MQRMIAPETSNIDRPYHNISWVSFRKLFQDNNIIITEAKFVLRQVSESLQRRKPA
jgi:hypothetical protein